MPLCDPRAATQKIQDTFSGTAPILFAVMVGTSLERNFINFDDLGVIGFIQKPITPEGLSSLLEKQDFAQVRSSWRKNILRKPSCSVPGRDYAATDRNHSSYSPVQVS